MRPADVSALEPAPDAQSPRLPARSWLTQAHARLRPLLPDSREALLTADLSDGQARPIDVFARFEIDRSGLQSLFSNWAGLRNTAQSSCLSQAIDKPSPDWPGFEQVWVPLEPGLSLSGRLGLARKDGQVRKADCIVVLPGFLGDNDNLRSREMSKGLVACGFHVLALELRGHGQTEARSPQVPYSFGVTETGDLLKVAEWLQDKPCVRRTGLLGFSWGANHVLLAAWYAAAGPSDASVPARLRPHLPPATTRPHFEAGVIACSPVPDFEAFAQRTRSPKTLVGEPVTKAIQDLVRARMARKKYPQVNGDVGLLVDREGQRLAWAYPDYLADAKEFLRLLPGPDQPPGGKLAAVRVPTLIVQAANDPLGTAQEVVELVAGLANPNVAVLMLPGGGHVGFPRYATRYYYSLVVNFFNTAGGPGVADPAPSTGPDAASQP